jgi:uncharacterized protein (TIGR00299 family) protein
MKTAYFDCFSGVSGDMVLGAFIDLGVPQGFIETEVGRVISGAFHLEVGRAERMGIGGTRVKVVLEGDEGSRDFGQIKALIEQSDLADTVKTKSLEIFTRLAQVEARIHGCPPEAVHFHEIGGVDAMVDVIGAVSATQWLGIEDIWSSEIPVGKGFVTCAHGVLPVPAPATAALLAGVPVVGTSVPAELVTPTGAAIVTTLSEGYGPLPRMHMDRVGYGVGETWLEDRPNLLRIVLGDREAVLHEDRIEVLETNIDDMNPEIFGYLMERLFEAGALDVIWMPVYMKKNRPGVMVQVLCEMGHREKMLKRILSETTTTGVRCYQAERKKLRRETKTVNTSLGAVLVKEIQGPDGTTKAPEYEDCRRIAREKNLPLKRVYALVNSEISKEKQG